MTDETPTVAICEDCGVSLSPVCWPCFLNRGNREDDPSVMGRLDDALRRISRHSDEPFSRSVARRALGIEDAP